MVPFLPGTPRYVISHRSGRAPQLLRALIWEVGVGVVLSPGLMAPYARTPRARAGARAGAVDVSVSGGSANAGGNGHPWGRGRYASRWLVRASVLCSRVYLIARPERADVWHVPTSTTIPSRFVVSCELHMQNAKYEKRIFIQYEFVTSYDFCMISNCMISEHHYEIISGMIS